LVTALVEQNLPDVPHKCWKKFSTARAAVK
jgi:hypothetical protein